MVTGIFENQPCFTAVMQSARPDSALVPFCILSMHLNLIPEPARSCQLLNPKEDQKGIFANIFLVVIP